MDRAERFDKTILDDTVHRPWPMPPGPWILTQTWINLMFAHWRVEAGVLRSHVPPAFELDLFDGTAWLGIVPFEMTNVTPRLLPALPWVSAFPELNVRTYVTAGGKPGVFFFSLDAGSPLAVRTARALLNLPYHSADMTVEEQGPVVNYTSRRRATPHASFAGRYRGLGDVRPAQRGTLEYFLTERYCLYAVDHQARPYRLNIHHRRWPLESAEAEITVNTMAEAAGVPVVPMDPLLHFSRRLDMVCWAPERLQKD